MDKKTEGLYLGIDINDRYTMLSFYQRHMDEPETVSTVMGSENYQIPTYLAKRRGVGQWLIGSEARTQVKLHQAAGVDQLLQKALDREEVYLEQERYEARDLLVIFLRKVLSIPGYYSSVAPVEKLVFTLEKLDLETAELFSMAASSLGLEASRVALVDYRESFYYYALSQEPQIFRGDVALFDYTQPQLRHCLLERNVHTTPQVVTLHQGNHGSLLDNRDLEFEQIIDRAFAGRAVSAVYLIGDGFDGDWMKRSLQKLCRGRRVFVGKNLYSKGACYAGFVKNRERDWPFVYMGDNELKINVFLKVLDQKTIRFYPLASAGESWYESRGECEVILDGTPEIEFWIQKPESREAHVEVLELTEELAPPDWEGASAGRQPEAERRSRADRSRGRSLVRFMAGFLSQIWMDTPILGRDGSLTGFVHRRGNFLTRSPGHPPERPDRGRGWPVPPAGSGRPVPSPERPDTPRRG